MQVQEDEQYQVDVSQRIVESDIARGVALSVREDEERIWRTSGSDSWAAAIALKSITGGESDRRALVCMQDRTSAGTLSSPFTYLMSEVY